MKTSPCGNCAQPFPKSRWGYCETCRALPVVKMRHGARINLTARPGMFVAVDGEGYTDPDGIHHYTMLSVGDDTLADPDGKHLNFETIMQFLWEHYEANPTGCFIGFFLGYDFTHWLATLPQERAYRLLHKQGMESRKPRGGVRSRNPVPFPVKYRGWEFDILSQVRFKLRKEGEKGWMYICDVGPYFQASFLSVIDPKNWRDPVCTAEEHAVLVAGKDARADVLTAAEWVALYPDTTRYNRTENRILAAVMDRMKEGLVAEGIHLERDQWFGPGQAAQGWLQAIGQPTGDAMRSTTPTAAQDAAQASYYGGWFEIFAHGHLAGDTYEYDINSAYPDAMTELPCPVHGAWARKLRGNLKHPYTLCNVRVTGSHPMVGSMQCRRPDGTIARPHEVEGWYWSFELAAAKRAGLIDTVQHLGAWQYTPAACPGTFDHDGKTFVCRAVSERTPEIYRRRIEVGKNSPHGKALKVVYNSAYGKFAQSIGKPKFGNAFHASFITARCRTKILDAIATHPEGADALVMVATDGVYFRAPHPGLDLTPEKLGAWEQSVKRNLTLLKPGVYWDDAARARLADGQLPKLKSRGISARDLADNLLRIDEEFRTEEFRAGFHWPTIRLTKHFNHISAKAAITRNNWGIAGQIEWQDGQPHVKATRVESASPIAKRDPLDQATIDRRGDLRLRPYRLTHPGGVSEPYSEKFGRMIEEDPRYRDDTANPEGPDHYTDELA